MSSSGQATGDLGLSPIPLSRTTDLPCLVLATYTASMVTWKENWSEVGVSGSRIRSCLFLASVSRVCNEDFGGGDLQGPFRTLQTASFLLVVAGTLLRFCVKRRWSRQLQGGCSGTCCNFVCDFYIFFLQTKQFYVCNVTPKS